MLTQLLNIVRDNTYNLQSRIRGIYTILIAFNVGIWILAVAIFQTSPSLLGNAVLAYTFGLRHAVDADHIAAIDNVTRKLMADGKKPIAVGFFFSLGHSTIVILATLAIALTATAFHQHFPFLQQWGGLIGTLVSSGFLLLIAAINILILFEIFHTFKQVRSGGEYNEKTVEASLAKRGFFNRILRPFYRFIDASWKMYPLGVLFGLGFDTATEIAG